LFAVRAGRALIGDDMGLGKTIQAIAATEILAQHFGVAKVLVVCPTSLKYQWQSEITRFSGRHGEHAARVINGGRAQRQTDYALDDFCKITNYEKLKPDLDLIAAWAPDLVIVDEAQRVKNWNTIAARALKRVDSPYAIVLTGTPLENKLEELISIVQFVDQHRLGPTWKLLHEHQVKDEAGCVTGYTRLEKIGQTLAPIMIRRRKSEVLRQLPARTDQTLLVPMTEMQMLYHQENADIVARIVQRWRKTRFLSDKDQRRMTCPAEHADVLQQHLSAGPGHRSRGQGRRIGRAVRGFVRLARRQRGGVFAVDADPRHRHPPPRSAQSGLRQLSRRRAVGEAAGTGRAVS
jgi:SNF2 family DNA or RNA helicase